MTEYSKVQNRIWNSKTFLQLNEDSKFLWLYLLTCPHGNIVGLFVLKPGYAQEDLGWSNPYGRSRHILVDIEIPFKKYSESMRNIKAVNSTLDVSELQVRSYVKLSDISYPAHIEHTCKCPCGKNK